MAYYDSGPGNYNPQHRNNGMGLLGHHPYQDQMQTEALNTNYQMQAPNISSDEAAYEYEYYGNQQLNHHETVMHHHISHGPMSEYSNQTPVEHQNSMNGHEGFQGNQANYGPGEPLQLQNIPNPQYDQGHSNFQMNSQGATFNYNPGNLHPAQELFRQNFVRPPAEVRGVFINPNDLCLAENSADNTQFDTSRRGTNLPVAVTKQFHSSTHNNLPLNVHTMRSDNESRSSVTSVGSTTGIYNYNPREVVSLNRNQSQVAETPKQTHVFTRSEEQTAASGERSRPKSQGDKFPPSHSINVRKVSIESKISSSKPAEKETKNRIFTGVVTQMQDNFGMIGDDVFFQKSAVKGPCPQVGDRCLVEAESVTAMPFKWNSKRVQIVNKDLDAEVHPKYLDGKVTNRTAMPGRDNPKPVPPPPSISDTGTNIFRVLDRVAAPSPLKSILKKKGFSPPRRNPPSPPILTKQSSDLMTIRESSSGNKYRPDTPDPVNYKPNSFSMDLCNEFPTVNAAALNMKAYFSQEAGDYSNITNTVDSYSRLPEASSNPGVIAPTYIRRSSRSPSGRRESHSPAFTRRQHSSEFRERSRSPSDRRRSRSPGDRRRSRSPGDRRRSRSPGDRRRSRSPGEKRRSRSPAEMPRSKLLFEGRPLLHSPEHRRYARSPKLKHRSRSPTFRCPRTPELRRRSRSPEFMRRSPSDERSRIQFPQGRRITCDVQRPDLTNWPSDGIILKSKEPEETFTPTALTERNILTHEISHNQPSRGTIPKFPFRGQAGYKLPAPPVPTWEDSTSDWNYNAAMRPQSNPSQAATNCSRPNVRELHPSAPQRYMTHVRPTRNLPVPIRFPIRGAGANKFVPNPVYNSNNTIISNATPLHNLLHISCSLPDKLSPTDADPVSPGGMSDYSFISTVNTPKNPKINDQNTHQSIPTLMNRTRVANPKLASASRPNPKLANASRPNPKLASVSTPNPKRGVASTPDPKRVVASTPDPKRVVASTPDPKRVVASTPVTSSNIMPPPPVPKAITKNIGVPSSRQTLVNKGTKTVHKKLQMSKTQEPAYVLKSDNAIVQEKVTGTPSKVIVLENPGDKNKNSKPDFKKEAPNEPVKVITPDVIESWEKERQQLKSNTSKNPVAEETSSVVHQKKDILNETLRNPASNQLLHRELKKTVEKGLLELRQRHELDKKTDKDPAQDNKANLVKTPVYKDTVDVTKDKGSLLENTTSDKVKDAEVSKDQVETLKVNNKVDEKSKQESISNKKAEKNKVSPGPSTLVSKKTPSGNSKDKSNVKQSQKQDENKKSTEKSKLHQSTRVTDISGIEKGEQNIRKSFLEGEKKLVEKGVTERLERLRQEEDKRLRNNKEGRLRELRAEEARLIRWSKTEELKTFLEINGTFEQRWKEEQILKKLRDEESKREREQRSKDREGQHHHHSVESEARWRRKELEKDQQMRREEYRRKKEIERSERGRELVRRSRGSFERELESRRMHSSARTEDRRRINSKSRSSERDRHREYLHSHSRVETNQRNRSRSFERRRSVSSSRPVEDERLKSLNYEYRSLRSRSQSLEFEYRTSRSRSISLERHSLLRSPYSSIDRHRSRSSSYERYRDQRHDLGSKSGSEDMEYNEYLIKHSKVEMLDPNEAERFSELELMERIDREREYERILAEKEEMAIAIAMNEVQRKQQELEMRELEIQDRLEEAERTRRHDERQHYEHGYRHSSPKRRSDSDESSSDEGRVTYYRRRYR